MKLRTSRTAFSHSRATPFLSARRLSALALALAISMLTGCSSAVEITSSDLSGEDEAACQALVDDLPDVVFEQDRVDVEGPGVGAAWGDPPVVLTCGAPASEDFTPWSRCSEIDGVGWFIPDAQLKDLDSDIVITAQSHHPRVRVEIPAEHRFKGPDTYLRELGEPIKEHLTETQPCR